MIYFLPGRRGRLNGVLGQQIKELGFDIIGREIIDDFEIYPIKKQLDIICNDIKANFWGTEHKLIGRSYGGYLIMHSLIELLPEPYPGELLLLSPVLGKSSNLVFYGSRPPRAKKILEYAKLGKLNELNIQIHTGDKDIGCDYKLAQEICSYMTNCKLQILKDATHYLSKDYTYKVLKEFLI